MSSEKVSWGLPSVGATQAPIAYVDVQLSADGGKNFASFSHVTPDQPQTETITELEPGDYIARLIVVDTQTPPKSSSPVDTSFNIPVPVKDAPGSVSSVTVSPA